MCLARWLPDVSGKCVADSSSYWLMARTPAAVQPTLVARGGDLSKQPREVQEESVLGEHCLSQLWGHMLSADF